MSGCPQKVRRHQAIFSLGIISDSRNRKEVTTIVIFYKINIYNIYRINIVRIITISECGALTHPPPPRAPAPK